MIAAEAGELVLHRLGQIRAELAGHGWRVELSGEARLAAVEVPPIETGGADPDALAEALAAAMASPTGNVCANCQHPTRPSGGCELCPNCGATSSCG